MMSSLRLVPSLLLSLWLPVVVQASEAVEPQVLTEEDFLGDAPIVLSATRLAQPITDSPAPMTVIDREMIEASGIRELYEIFRLVPGFQVGSESGTVHTVTHHGLSDQFNGRLQVLVDGRSVYNPVTGSVEWTELPLAIEDIDRIEVIRGPNAVTHGSNAFLGVISIYTRHASQDVGMVKIRKGERGTEDAVLRFNHSLGDLDYRLTLRYQEDDGFENLNDSKRVRLATLRTDYQLSIDDSLEFQFGYTDGPRGTGFAPSTVDRDNNFQLLRWHHVNGPGNEIVAQFYRNFDRRHERRPVGPFSVNASGDSERYDAEIHQIIDPANGWRWVWGGSYRMDEATAPLFFGSDDTLDRETYRVFGNAEWRMTPDTIVNAGLMWEKNDFVGSELSPRLAINYHLTPNQAVRASIQRATGTPTFFEEEADFVVPPGVQLFTSEGGLDPQEVIARELGYVATYPAAGLEVDINIFRNSLSDLISSVPGMGPTRVWANRSSATVKGLEAHLDWRPNRDSRLVLGYGYADTDSDDRDLEQSTPEHSLSLLGIYHFSSSLMGSAAYYRVSEQRWLETGDLISDYDRLDLRLAYGFHYAGAKHGELALVAQNVLDEYEDFSTDNQFDTRIFATLKLEI